MKPRRPASPRPIKGWAIRSFEHSKLIILGHGITKRAAYCKWRMSSHGECEELVRIETRMVSK